MDETVETPGWAATCETVVDDSGIPTLKLTGELDIGSVDPIRAAFDAAVVGTPARVIIDLSDLRFIDSTGLSLFLAVANQVSEVELRDPSPMVRRVIDITGLSSVFVITPAT